MVSLKHINMSFLSLEHGKHGGQIKKLPSIRIHSFFRLHMILVHIKLFNPYLKNFLHKMNTFSPQIIPIKCK
jgi:hypothetical protein